VPRTACPCGSLPCTAGSPTAAPCLRRAVRIRTDACSERAVLQGVRFARVALSRMPALACTLSEWVALPTRSCAASRCPRSSSHPRWPRAPLGCGCRPGRSDYGKFWGTLA
jgi:hypothetical protein